MKAIYKLPVLVIASAVVATLAVLLALQTRGYVTPSAAQVSPRYPFEVTYLSFGPNRGPNGGFGYQRLLVSYVSDAEYSVETLDHDVGELILPSGGPGTGYVYKRINPTSVLIRKFDRKAKTETRHQVAVVAGSPDQVPELWLTNGFLDFQRNRAANAPSQITLNDRQSASIVTKSSLGAATTSNKSFDAISASFAQSLARYDAQTFGMSIRESFKCPPTKAAQDELSALTSPLCAGTIQPSLQTFVYLRELDLPLLIVTQSESDKTPSGILVERVTRPGAAGAKAEVLFSIQP